MVRRIRKKPWPVVSRWPKTRFLAPLASASMWVAVCGYRRRVGRPLTRFACTVCPQMLVGPTLGLWGPWGPVMGYARTVSPRAHSGASGALGGPKWDLLVPLAQRCRLGPFWGPWGPSVGFACTLSSSKMTWTSFFFWFRRLSSV